MRGAVLILLFFLLISFFHYSRWALPERDELPAVLRLQPQLSTVAMAEDRGIYGLYQFSDGSKISDVIKLTEEIPGQNFLPMGVNEQPIITGEYIKVSRFAGNYIRVERSWLSAKHRMLLQIPLHPDRMSTHDWEFLPGIGPKLAQAISVDRQKNGDFRELTALNRVKGIGPKKIKAWQEYFAEKNELKENR